MLRFTVLSLSIAAALACFAQQHICGVIEGSGAPGGGGGGTGGCGNLQDTQFDNTPYRSQDFYIPYPDGHPLLPTTSIGLLRPIAEKTINISVHIWSDPDGAPGHQYEDDVDGLNRGAIVNIINEINARNFIGPNPPTDPAIDPVDYDYFLPTRMSLNLVGVWWHENFVGWNTPTCQGGGATLNSMSLDDMSIADQFTSIKTVRLHIVKQGCCGDAAGGAPESPFLGSTSSVNDRDAHAISCKRFLPTIHGDEEFWIHHWAHELGHSFGLKHLHDAVENQSGLIDFLEDVYSCHQQEDWCTTIDCSQPVATFCNFIATWNCTADAAPDDQCTNNYMSNNDEDHYFLSPMQKGRMHRTLSTCFLSRYAWGYNPTPYVIGASETWEWPVKFYQDIRVSTGSTLTVKCTIDMVPEARIIVEPGAHLIIDGGTVRAGEFASGFWRGVEVWGDPSQPQHTLVNSFAAHQGLVTIRNGGRIESAEIGILVGSRDHPLVKAGGVVIINGAPGENNELVNCQTGIRFEPYSYQVPGTSIIQNNQSRFVRASFRVNSGYYPPFYFAPDSPGPFNAHVVLDGVRGIAFKACSFVHDAQYQQPATSAELGHGIVAHNSTFSVDQDCPAGLPCIGSSFYGLDHAVRSTGPYGRFSIRNSSFMQNVCGIYANGQHKLSISDNTFAIGVPNVALTHPDEDNWFDHHRGIFLTECGALHIKGNSLRDNPLLPQGTVVPSEGVVVGFTREWGDIVRQNVAQDLTRGFIGEGVCASSLGGVEPYIRGLQFICNTNYISPNAFAANPGINEVNFRTRTPPGTLNADVEFCTIRLLQGLYVGNQIARAGNRFDGYADCGTGLDYDVQTNHAIGYVHQVEAQFEPVCVAGPFLPFVVNPGTVPGCEIFPFTDPGPQSAVEWEALALAERTAYGELRYLYDALIDGGSTDEVVGEIVAAWPQDFIELRDYLLANSPYLSTEVLQAAMEKAGFPDAMRAEVCLANPEATQKDGFLKWLALECAQPLPQHLIDAIEASWEAKTYRWNLENAMAGHHALHSEAVITLLDYQDDPEAFDPDRFRAGLQVLRTVDARYAEVFLLMDQHRYAEAEQVMNALQLEERLKARELDERQRMLWWIGYSAALHQQGRTLAQLTAAEVSVLQAQIAPYYDRVTNAISQSLCFYHGVCHAPLTGGDEGPKARRRGTNPSSPQYVPARLRLAPNPATGWAVASWPVGLGTTELAVRDASGRVVLRQGAGASTGEAVLDTHGLAPGTYVVELLNGSIVLAREKLVVQ